MTSESSYVAGLYFRISDDREGRELGVDRQDKDCTQVAKYEGATVYDRYRDNDISASVKSRKARPEYNRLLADARAGRINMIIAYTTGRLTRRPREHEDLIELAEKHGIVFRYVRSPSFDLTTAQGRRVARTLAAQDAGEAEEISERVRAAVVQRAERGEAHGGTRRFGVTADGLNIVESEAEIIRGWCEHILAGGSLYGLVAKMKKDGVKTPDRLMTRRKKVNGRLELTQENVGAKHWRDFSIRRIVMNPGIAGIRVLDGVRYPTPYPAIVSEDIWQAVVDILSQESRKKNHAGTARKHLGTGLFLCIRCGGRPVNTGYHANGYLVYKCLKCWRQWQADPLNEFINELVEDILAHEDKFEHWLPKTEGGAEGRSNQLRAEAAAIKQNMATIAEKFMFAPAGSVTMSALQSALQAAENRLNEISQELTATGRKNALGALLVADDPLKKWREMVDLGLRQTVISSLMTVELDAPLRGRQPWDPEKFVRITPNGGSQ